MADLSFSFNPSDISAASDAASKAMSKISGDSATWDKASAASSKIAAQSANWEASTAESKIAAQSATWEAGLGSSAVRSIAKSDAASKVAVLSGVVNSMSGEVIRSTPATASRAVHEIVYTSAGLIKYVYSSNAAA